MANKIGEVILHTRFTDSYIHYEVYYLKDAHKGMESWKGHDSYWVNFAQYKSNKYETGSLKGLTLGEMHKEIIETLEKDKKYHHYSVITNTIPSEVWDIAKREHMMLNL